MLLYPAELLRHFLYSGQEDSHNTDPLPILDEDTDITYRIAYLALCIEDSKLGGKLLLDLASVAGLGPGFIQFGCSDWFWVREVNTYVLQVEPDRFMNMDTATVPYREALHIEKTRDAFFKEIRHILSGIQAG